MIKNIISKILRFQSPYMLTEDLLNKTLEGYYVYVKGLTIDLGCGSFRFSKKFIPYVKEMYGVDNWIANEKILNKIPKDAKFCFASIDQTPFKNSSFNAALCTEVLEHVEDLDAVIKEAYRIIKPKGYLLISVPFNCLIHGSPNDFRRLTIHGLDKLVKKYNFKIVKYSLVGSFRYSIINNIISYFGFKKKFKFINNIIVVFLNLIGYMLQKFDRQDTKYSKISRDINDRTNPIGYVFVARSKKVGTFLEKTKKIKLVCIFCYNNLKLKNHKLHCLNCDINYSYFNKIPILAEKQKLHLVHETTGNKVKL